MKATTILSKCKVGAIISIEQGQSMQDYIKTGVSINSEVSKQLLSSIFMTTTPLHDGKRYYSKGNKNSLCQCLYHQPPEVYHHAMEVQTSMLTLGISEVTDCLTVVVVEETSKSQLLKRVKCFM